MYTIGPMKLFMILGALMLAAFITKLVLNMLKSRETNTSIRSAPADRTEPQPATEKKRWGWVWWVLAVLAAVYLTWIVTNFMAEKRQAEEARKHPSVATVDKIVKYDYYWKTLHGEYVNGQTEAKSDERTLELVKLDDGHFYLDQQYSQGGIPQTATFRMLKTRDGSWKGRFEQSLPEDHGLITMREEEGAPGRYSGVQERDNGVIAICNINLRAEQ